jgi:hypothetical protein
MVLGVDAEIAAQLEIHFGKSHVFMFLLSGYQ